MDKEEYAEKERRARVRSNLHKLIEWLVWVSCSGFWAYTPIRYFFYGINGLITFKAEYFTLNISLASILFLFPVLFWLIFSELPIEFLRNQRKRRLSHGYAQKISKDEISLVIEGDSVETPLLGTPHAASNKSEQESIMPNMQKAVDQKLLLLEVYAERSNAIAGKLYTRSGAYLLIGCLIAFCGVLFFYLQAAEVHKTLSPKLGKLTTPQILFEYLPRIGTLVFVEAIAFFFLKQYRLTMGEYRYYEAIKRQRENQLCVLSLHREYQSTPDTFKTLIEALNFSDNPNKLSNGESNSMLELEKLAGSNVDVLQQITDILKLYKK